MIYEERAKLLQANIYDPNLIQIQSLTMLSEFIKDNGNIPDPTNPFMFLLENSAMMTSSAMKEVASAMRKSYPVLASSKEDLYGYINNSEINNIFSTPSRGRFNLLIDLEDIKNYGYRTTSYSIIKIPKYSNITVDDYVFTILNDISIYVYDNDTTFAKYDYNDLDISYNTDTILETTIVTDNNGRKWVLINIEIQQIKRYVVRDSLFNSTIYKNEITLNNNELYTYLRARSVNGVTNEIIGLDVTFSYYVYNPNKPSIIVRPDNSKINIEIPYIYNVNNSVSKYVELEIFTTLGDKLISLNNYETTDFIINIELPPTTDLKMIALDNITIIANSNSYTYGGNSEITFEELKSTILNYSTGDNKLPITVYEIEKRIKEFGFIFKKIETGILSHSVLITKYIGNLNYDIYSSLDTVGSLITFDLSKINSDKIILTNNEKSLVIEPYQLYEKVDSEKLKILSTSERAAIKELAANDVNEYNKRNIFFNIYKFVLDYEDELNIRVYDVNSPSLLDYKTTFTTSSLDTTFLISDRFVTNNYKEYTLYFKIPNNSSLNSLDLTTIFGQIAITLDNYDKIYFKGGITLDSNNDLILTIVIPINEYIDKDDKLKVTTSYGALLSTTVDLKSKIELVIYSTDPTLQDNNAVTNKDVIVDNASIIFYRETLLLEFGKKLDNLYSFYDVNYSTRKFKTYTETVYKTHTTDVYETDADGSIKLIGIDTDGDDENDDVTINKLFSVGDNVLDSDGNPIVLHNIGDIMLDEYNKPIIDPYVGIEHNVYMLLLEDCFLRTTKDDYINYRRNYFLELTRNITEVIEPINEKLLDNTKIKFTPNIIDKDVVLLINDKEVYFSNIVSPVVKFYIDNESLFSINEELERNIYNIISSEITVDNTIGDIENKIKSLVNNDEVLTVKLSIIPDRDDINVIRYIDNGSRFVIRKILTMDESSNIIVIPDIKISIVRI